MTVGNPGFQYPLYLSPVLRLSNGGGLVFTDAVRLLFAIYVAMTSPYSLVVLGEYLPL